jgi:hypothetical protein
MAKLTEVFTPNDVPTITYVQRPSASWKNG